MNKLKEALANRNKITTFAASNVPHETSLLISDSIRTNTVDKLTELLNTLFDLRNITRMSHWNIKGSNFSSVHKLLDDIQSDVDDYIDEVAEIIVAFGGVAKLTSNSTSLSDVNITEYCDDINKCLTKLASLFSYVIKDITDMSSNLDNYEDKVNANYLLELAAKLIKFVYLIEAHNA